MAVMYYWTGQGWEPIASGGGGDGSGTGPQGPPGADGQSVEVFGPQAAQPSPIRKGDVWIQEFARAEPPLQLAGPADVAPRTVTVVGLAAPQSVQIVYLNY